MLENGITEYHPQVIALFAARPASTQYEVRKSASDVVIDSLIVIVLT